MTPKTVNPPTLAAPRGYAHGMVAEGRVLALAGQIAWDKNCKLVSSDFAEQFGQALANLVEVVRAAGGQPEHVIALRTFVVDKKQYLAATKAVGEKYRAYFGRHFPAMSLVQVAGLLEDGALVEIEGLAVLPS